MSGRWKRIRGATFAIVARSRPFAGPGWVVVAFVVGRALSCIIIATGAAIRDCHDTLAVIARSWSNPFAFCVVFEGA